MSLNAALSPKSPATIPSPISSPPSPPPPVLYTLLEHSHFLSSTAVIYVRVPHPPN